MTDFCAHCCTTVPVTERREAGCTVWICLVCGRQTDIDFDDEEDENEPKEPRP